MRTAFVETLIELADKNSKIWLLTGDLGFGTLEPFATKFPERFINAGVAEQNMMGLATGLALSGKTVFVYSIANFATMRCLEQIRNDVVYHQASVIVVSVGGGFTYGTQGYTHYAIEDLAVMGAFGNMRIVAPGDPVETRELLPQITMANGPCYLRLGRAGEPIVHRNQLSKNITLGKALLVRNGVDITIISTGGMLKPCIDVADVLEKKGVSVRVISMHTYRPLDIASVLDSAQQTRGIVTVEEHVLQGGLGTSVADVLVEHSMLVPLIKIGASIETTSLVGTQAYMRKKMGSISDAVWRVLNNSKG